jgi:hypothetical protein
MLINRSLSHFADCWLTVSGQTNYDPNLNTNKDNIINFIGLAKK